jgi:hypothetical protein
MGRILLGGLLGAILMFAWGFVTHTKLARDAGPKSPASNEALLGALRENLTESGVYEVATLEPGTDPNAADALEKMIPGPHAFLVYTASGQVEMGKALGIEFGTNFLAAFFIAWAVRSSRGGYLGRVAAATLFGVVAWLSISASQWNWYEFPWSLVQVDLIEQVGGWFLAGLAIAAVARPAESAS